MYTRLYYERVGRAGMANGGRVDTAESLQNAAEKVAKIIPVELVTAYGALVSAATSIGDVGLRPWAFAVVFAVCWVLTPIYLNKVADAVLPQRNHLIVSTIAFPVWAYLVSGNQAIPQLYDPAIATIVAMLFSLISGLVPLNK